MKKNLKYILIFVGFVLIVFFVKNTINQKFDKGVNINNSKWEKDYPKIFNNSGYSKLIESKEILNQLKNNPESLQELQGKITNQFGIRDDILEYIISLNLDEKASYASIRMAQSEYFSYFFTDNKIDINNFANNEMLSSYCLMNFVGFDLMHQIHSEIDKKLRDTKDRNKRMVYVDSKYLAFSVIGTGLSTADEKLICVKGEF